MVNEVSWLMDDFRMLKEVYGMPWKTAEFHVDVVTT
jgi:hypothetical protein